MKRLRFSEEQIIAVLREHEAGTKTADLAHKHGISEATNGPTTTRLFESAKDRTKCGEWVV
jgi:hypothetical protein